MSKEMKYVVVVGDGMSDRPLKELDGGTPLEAARKPHMDSVARDGKCGLLRTLYDELPSGSDVANMSILGYDPREYYPGGRGPLEAASIGVVLGEDDLAFRCNLITTENGLFKDYSGGRISSEDARELIKEADNKLGSESIRFYPGVSYRNLLVLSGGEYSSEVDCTPPHDVLDKPVKEYLVKPKSSEGKATADLLNRLVNDSREILAGHPLVKENKVKANLIWPWGQGRRPSLPSFQSKLKLSGALISAVDLLKGLAVYMGLKVIEVPGATGYIDTDYEGKADAALKALEEVDLVVVHVEATDEMGHEGDIEGKVKAIEELDKRVIGRLLNNIEGDYVIGILPDHVTPIKTRTHDRDPVPFAIKSTKQEGDEVGDYSEKSAAQGSYSLREGYEFMTLMKKAGK